MSERFLTGYNNFVLPFLCGFAFVLIYCLIGMVRVIAQLPGEDRQRFFVSLVTPKTFVKNVKDLFCNCLFHVRLWQRNKLLGYMHTAIAFGWFMLIVIGHIEVLCYFPGRAKYIYYPIFFRYFTAATGETTVLEYIFFFLMDFFLLVVLSGIVLAIVKRIRSAAFGMRRTTNQSMLDFIGLYSLWAIFPLRLLAEGFTANVSGGSFLTKPVNWLFASFLGNPANMTVTWWAYSIALCVFFCFLPFTRYMHIPAEILLIPLRNAGIRISHPRKGMALAQVYTCPACGVCIDACPMGIMRTHLKDTTVYLNRQIRRGNEPRIERISEKCLLCGKCTAVCQVGVQGDALRVAQRSLIRYNVAPDYSGIDVRAVMAANGLVSAIGVSGCVRNEVSSNIGDSLCVEKMDRASESDSSQKEKVLYFAGCMTALTPQISRAVGSVFDKAGVEYEFMDRNDGICCGRPMWMAGRLEQARQMMEKNTQIIRASGVTTLLLSCPICYRIFKEKYDLEGIEVIHHTQYFERLIRTGRIAPRRSEMRLAYHDPCELGRGCGVYDEPRQVISAVGELVEAAKNRKESICCGGSVGSLTLDYEQREPMVENALRNLAAGSPDGIVTACPLCFSTFNHYSSLPVKDIAEVLDRSIS